MIVHGAAYVSGLGVLSLEQEVQGLFVMASIGSEFRIVPAGEKSENAHAHDAGFGTIGTIRPATPFVLASGQKAKAFSVSIVNFADQKVVRLLEEILPEKAGNQHSLNKENGEKFEHLILLCFGNNFP